MDVSLYPTTSKIAAKLASGINCKKDGIKTPANKEIIALTILSEAEYIPTIESFVKKPNTMIFVVVYKLVARPEINIGQLPLISKKISENV